MLWILVGASIVAAAIAVWIAFYNFFEEPSQELTLFNWKPRPWIFASIAGHARRSQSALRLSKF
jgi:hypothetical protein